MRINPPIESKRAAAVLFLWSFLPFFIVATAVLGADPRPNPSPWALLAAIGMGLMAIALSMFGWWVRSRIGLVSRKRQVGVLLTLLCAQLPYWALFALQCKTHQCHQAMCFPVWVWRASQFGTALLWLNFTMLKDPPLDLAVFDLRPEDLIPSGLFVLPGTHLRHILRVFYARRTCERLFDPVLADMQSEWVEATLAKHRWRARWYRLRGYWHVTTHMGLHSIVNLVRSVVQTIKGL